MATYMLVRNDRIVEECNMRDMRDLRDLASYLVDMAVGGQCIDDLKIFSTEPVNQTELLPLMVLFAIQGHRDQGRGDELDDLSGEYADVLRQLMEKA